MIQQPSSRTCFLCGRQNDIGLKITWHGAGGGARATVVVPEYFNGYPGIVHGGIVAAILDDPTQIPVRAVVTILMRRSIVCLTSAGLTCIITDA